MKKNYKKHILSTSLIFGTAITPILIGSSLLISNSNIDSNKTNIDEKNISVLTQPLVPSDGVINKVFINELIAYKKTLIAVGDVWDGVLIESDFTGGTRINIGAFENNTEVTSITLPDTVSRIGQSVFKNASKLTNISALGVKNIEFNTFTGATSIINKGIKLTASSNIKYTGAYNWGTTREKLDILAPKVQKDGIITEEFVKDLVEHKKDLTTTWDGVLVESDFVGGTSVANGAFSIYDKFDIISITLPNTVLSIGPDAFTYMLSLTNISALGVTSIGANAFKGSEAIIPGGIKLTYSEKIKPGNISNWGVNSFEQVSIANLPNKPVVSKGIITSEFVKELIIYKNSLLSDSASKSLSLIQSDFIGATSVADGAFQNNNNIVVVRLPVEVKTIGDNAFAGAQYLNKIYAKGATSIGTNAFSGMINIYPEGIKLTTNTNINPDQASIWGTTPDKLVFTSLIEAPIIPEDGVITYDFVDYLVSYKRWKVDYEDWDGILVADDFVGGTSVAAGAFRDNIKITSVNLPTTVALIGANAFQGASKLTTISALGATTIGNGAFTGTKSITNGGIKLTYNENINVSKASDWGTTVEQLDITNEVIQPIVPGDGIITSWFVKQLIVYKKQIITNWDGSLIESDFTNAISIADGAFKNNNEVNSINLPLSIRLIKDNAFSGAINLTNISALGATSIGNNAFAGMTKMSNSGIKLTKSTNINISKASIWGTTAEKLDITAGIILPPIIPPNGIITSGFIGELIVYKKETITNWNGSLIESDLTNGTSIAAGAFQNNNEVTSINLPLSLIKIGANAFQGASNLTTISALGATSIGNNAFAGMTKMSNDGIKLIESENINLDQAVNWGIDVEKLNISLPSEPGFFDNINNIYIVAGAGGGLLLIIIGIVTGILIHHKKSNDESESDYD